MGESGLVHGDNGDQDGDFQPLIERLTAPLSHQATGDDGGQQRLSRVHLGNNIHSGDLVVPAGQTWEIDGAAKIEGDAMIKIEDGATLQVNGHQATSDSGGQGHQRLSRVRSQWKQTPDVLGALLLRPDSKEVEQQRLQAELDGIASAWRSASLNDLQSVFSTALLSNSEPTLLLHLVNELQSAADQVAQAAGSSAAGGFDTKTLQRMMSTAVAMAGEIDQMDFGSSTALHMAEKMQATAAEMARMTIDPTLGAALESRVSWAEGISKSVATPMAESTLMQVAEMLRRQDQTMAAQLTRAVQPLIAQTNDMQAALRVADQYRQWASTTAAASEGVLLRLRPEPPAERGLRVTQAMVLVELERRRPEPPAARLLVVHLEDEVLTAELDRRLLNDSLSPTGKRSMARLLQAYAGRGKPGPQAPLMEKKIELIEDYERMKEKEGISQAIYVAHHAGRILPVSLRSFQTYMGEVRLWRESHSSTE